MLDMMQKKLFSAFEATSSYNAENRVALAKTAEIILAIETEKRIRAEYKPRSTLDKK
jgi:hypothetical protein